MAIAIPIFTSQLEKSRDSVSVSNMRAAYAEAMTAYLSGSSGDNATYDKDAKTVTVANVAIKSQKSDSWSELGAELPFTAPNDTGDGPTTKKMVFNFSADANKPTVTFG